MYHYIVQVATAKMPAKCWGRYNRVAVIEVHSDLTRVKMISEHARGVIRIVATWEKCNVGKTARCAYRVALSEAEAMCARLNDKARAIVNARPMNRLGEPSTDAEMLCDSLSTN